MNALISLRRLLAVLTLLCFGVSGSGFADANAESPYDSGLNQSFRLPDAAFGVSRNIVDYGATPGDASDDDSVAINLAIQAAKKGDEVFLPEGVFHCQSQITLASHVSLRGASESATVLDARLSSYTQLIKISSGRTNINVENLTITRGGGSLMKGAFEIGTDTGSNCTRIALRNLTIEHFEERGINVRNANHVFISQVTARDATNLGGGGNGYGIALNNANNHNNWVADCTLGPNVRHGVLIQDSAHHNLVEYCEAFENAYDCFDLHGSQEYSNEFRFNIARDSARAGFGTGNTAHAASGPNNWFHHNSVFRCQEGVTVVLGSNAQIIEENEMIDCSDFGVRIYNGGGDDVLVKANSILNCRMGIYADEAIGLVVEGNIIDACSNTGVKTGLLATGYSITNNDLRGNNRAVSLGSDDGVYSGNLE